MMKRRQRRGRGISSQLATRTMQKKTAKVVVGKITAGWAGSAGSDRIVRRPVRHGIAAVWRRHALFGSSRVGLGERRRAGLLRPGGRGNSEEAHLPRRGRPRARPRPDGTYTD